MTALLCALSLVVLTQSPVVSVSFDLRALPEQDYRRWDGVELERKVALRLIQEGFAVVSPRGPAQLRLRASRTPDGLLLEAVGPRQRVEQRVRVGRGSIAELHLEVAQKLAEMTRAVQPEPEPEPSPPEPVLQPPVEVAAAPPVHASGVDLGLGLGTLWGGPGVAPHLLLSARWGLGELGLDVETGLGVSREPALNVFEVQAGAFFSYRHAVSERLRLEPAVGAGLVVHAFRLEDTWVSEPRGTQVSPAGWARLKLGWRFTERLAAEVRVALGLLRPVTHVREGETLWSRGGARLETGVQLSWGL